MRNTPDNRKQPLLVRTVRKLLLGLMPAEGFEPPTNGLQSRKPIVIQLLEDIPSFHRKVFLILAGLTLVVAAITGFLHSMGNR